MNNIKIITIENYRTGEQVEYVFIANSDGSETSMTKEYYDAQQAAQATLVSDSATPQA